MSWRAGRDRDRRRSAQRPSEDHVHPEYWTEHDHIRFEDRVSGELHQLRGDVGRLSERIGRLFGALALLAFLLPLIIVVALRFLFPPGP